MKNLFFVLTVAALLSACSDGVPKVADPNHPLDADGKPISGIEFMKKYCTGKPANEDCAKVSKAVSINSGKGGLPKGY